MYIEPFSLRKEKASREKENINGGELAFAKIKTE